MNVKRKDCAACSHANRSGEGAPAARAVPEIRNVKLLGTLDAVAIEEGDAVGKLCGFRFFRKADGSKSTGKAVALHRVERVHCKAAFFAG